MPSPSFGPNAPYFAPAAPYFAPALAAVAMPVSPELAQTVQRTVNEVAESCLLGRRLMDVCYTNQVVPALVGPKVPEKVPASLPAWSHAGELASSGTLLRAVFEVDTVALQGVLGHRHLAVSPQLAQAVRLLARLENNILLSALIEQARKAGAVASDLFGAYEGIRNAGHLDPLIAVASGATIAGAAKAGQLSHLRELYTEGLLPGRFDASEHACSAVALAPWASGAVAVIGRNFEVQWLGWGPDAGEVLRFSVSVGVTAVVPGQAAGESAIYVVD